MTKSNSFASTILRWPLVWGALASLGFYALVHQGPLTGEFSHRYFSSHPVEYVTVTMFFIGLAALAVKTIDIALQRSGLSKPLLGPPSQGGDSIDDVETLFERLGRLPGRLQNGYLVSRVRDALEYIRRKGSADSLDEHLRYTSDLDADKMHSSYALVRIIIWAIPILGFLGTVIGITLAIAKLGPQDLENSLPEVVTGLKIAFDTTALALALSIVLMFTQHVVERFETRLLTAVDARVGVELVGRFQEYGTATDPQVATVRRMADTMVEASQRLVEQQAELWQASIEAAHQHWTQSASHSGKQIENALTGALSGIMQQHAETLAASEASVAEKVRQHLDVMTAALSHSADDVARQQKDLLKQGDILLRVVDATGHVKELESTLNENLGALAGASHFEETVTSLAAAIQLLTTHLRVTPAALRRVELQPGESATSAA